MLAVGFFLWIGFAVIIASTTTTLTTSEFTKKTLDQFQDLQILTAEFPNLKACQVLHFAGKLWDEYAKYDQLEVAEPWYDLRIFIASSISELSDNDLAGYAIQQQQNCSKTVYLLYSTITPREQVACSALFTRIYAAPSMLDCLPAVCKVLMDRFRPNIFAFPDQLLQKLSTLLLKRKDGSTISLQRFIWERIVRDHQACSLLFYPHIIPAIFTESFSVDDLQAIVRILKQVDISAVFPLRVFAGICYEVLRLSALPEAEIVAFAHEVFAKEANIKWLYDSILESGTKEGNIICAKLMAINNVLNPGRDLSMPDTSALITLLEPEYTRILKATHGAVHFCNLVPRVPSVANRKLLDKFVSSLQDLSNVDVLYTPNTLRKRLMNALSKTLGILNVQLPPFPKCVVYSSPPKLPNNYELVAVQAAGYLCMLMLKKPNSFSALHEVFKYYRQLLIEYYSAGKYYLKLRDKMKMICGRLLEFLEYQYARTEEIHSNVAIFTLFKFMAVDLQDKQAVEDGAVQWILLQTSVEALEHAKKWAPHIHNPLVYQRALLSDGVHHMAVADLMQFMHQSRFLPGSIDAATVQVFRSKEAIYK